MKRYVPGIGRANAGAEPDLTDGLFLGRVERVQYCRQGRKPYYLLSFKVFEPESLAGNRFSARLYCTPKTLWKLNWFLRDFGYDTELLSRGEINDQALIGLQGVVKVSYATVKGMFYLNFDAFAPAEQWKDLSPVAEEEQSGSEVA